jgi:hypothetical protein
MAGFAKGIPRSEKRTIGRTAVRDTPLSIRSDVPLDDAKQERIRRALGRALGHMATHIERVTVRFEDVNGPRGGVDTLCRIKVVISGSQSVLVEQRAKDATRALLAATPRLARALKRNVDKRGGGTPAATRGRPAEGGAVAPVEQPDDPGSFIDRRVGHSDENLEAALARPEKRRRDHYVDTARPGTSASDRRAGGVSTARRNSKRSSVGMTAMLEDSRTQPSRKSTRRSTNRTKSGTPLTGRQKTRTASPQARNLRGK